MRTLFEIVRYKRAGLYVAGAIFLCHVAAGHADGLRWFKGNTHTHTTNSDGDSSPTTVAHWYRNNGYDFLVLTDHNKRTEVDALNAELNALNRSEGKKPFLVIGGEEVSDKFVENNRSLPLHTCGMATETTIGAQNGNTKTEILQRSADAILAQGGIPHLNHPNFGWAVTADDLFQLKKLKHFEIFNGHPSVNNHGGGGALGTEQMWDSLLSRNRLYYGVAVDDAHHFKRFARDQSNPGLGWVVVRAAELNVKLLVEAMNEGNFYASTGVVLDDVSTTDGKVLGLTIKPTRDYKFHTDFIGEGGRILLSDETTSPVYQLGEKDHYVRAKVTSSNGDYAWSQPLFSSSRKPVH